MKQQFEDEIKRLHLELDMARKQSSQAANISSSKASSTTTAAANPDNSSSTKFTNANPAARPEIPPPNLDSSGFGVFAPITNGQQPQVSGGGE